MSVTAVVAVGENGVIGDRGAIPWHLPADLAHFKELTLGHVLVMGRATYDSIGRPLPGRTTVVVTRDPDWTADGVLVAHSVPDALALARGIDDEVYVVGGAQIYAEALRAGLVDELVVSHVPVSAEGNAFFEIPDDWSEVSRESREGFAVARYRR